MITGGAIRKEKLILSAGSPADANSVKGGLAGQNSSLSTSPYGNKVDLSIEGQNLSLVKDSRLPFTYEEVRTIIKKIQAFERITKKNADIILESAREILGARLTFFYPHTQKPSVEFAFSYNWASIEISNPNFQTIYAEVRDAITRNQGSSIKVFSNNMDIISIHNYSLKGIYLKRKSYEEMADIFIKHGLFDADDRKKFIVRAAAFGTKSVIYMDARQLSQKNDETFDLENDANYTPRIGAKHFLKPIVETLDKLSRQGVFSTLLPEHIKIMHVVLEKPEMIVKYSLAETIKDCVVSFISDFSEEINDAYRDSPKK